MSLYASIVNLLGPRVSLQDAQRGLKDTERKPLGLLYLGVTQTTKCFAVQTLTQVKHRLVLWKSLCTNAAEVARSISQLEYFWSEYT